MAVRLHLVPATDWHHSSKDWILLFVVVPLLIVALVATVRLSIALWKGDRDLPSLPPDGGTLGQRAVLGLWRGISLVCVLIALLAIQLTILGIGRVSGHNLRGLYGLVSVVVAGGGFLMVFVMLTNRPRFLIVPSGRRSNGIFDQRP